VANGWRGPASDSLPYEFPEGLHYYLPKDAGAKTLLARSLAGFFADQMDGALWITDWGAFGNLQNQDLFYGYRRSLGETRLLIDAPFHVWSKSEVASIESILGLTLYFFWDALLFKGDRQFVLRTSNDEFFDIYARTAAKRDDVRNTLSFLGLSGREESQASLMRLRVTSEDLAPVEERALEELRHAARSCPQFSVLRGYLAECIFRALFFAQEQRQDARYEALLDELRALAKDFPQDASVNRQLAKSLFYAISCSIRASQVTRCNVLVQEIRELAAGQPKDEEIQSWIDALEW